MHELPRLFQLNNQNSSHDMQESTYTLLTVCKIKNSRKIKKVLLMWFTFLKYGKEQKHFESYHEQRRFVGMDERKRFLSIKKYETG